MNVVYRSSSRTARTMQRNLVFKNKNKTTTKRIKLFHSQVVVMHTFNPSTQEAEKVDFYESEDNLIYRVGSRTARAIE